MFLESFVIPTYIVKRPVIVHHPERIGWTQHNRLYNVNEALKFLPA